MNIEFRNPPPIAVADPDPKNTGLSFLKRVGWHEFEFENRSNQFEGNAMATEREVSEQAIAAAEARTDAKIAAMTGEMRTIAAALGGKLDTLGEKLTSDHEYNRSTRWVMVGLSVALAALLVGMATYGDALFSRGMNVRDVIQSTIKDYDAQKKPQYPPN